MIDSGREECVTKSLNFIEERQREGERQKQEPPQVEVVVVVEVEVAEESEEEEEEEEEEEDQKVSQIRCVIEKTVALLLCFTLEAEEVEAVKEVVVEVESTKHHQSNYSYLRNAASACVTLTLPLPLLLLTHP